MHYERAGDTRTIRDLKLPTPWEKLPEDTRRDLLRRHHAAISAEMVQASIRSNAPPVGIQVTGDIFPESVAALCEAHTLDANSPLYAQLTQREPRIRMGLVSGLLRIADILDESRRRATREKARTLLLDLTSQTHWWRHMDRIGVAPTSPPLHPRGFRLGSCSPHPEQALWRSRRDATACEGGDAKAA